MTIREIITLVPAAADIMMEYGLHCFSCAVGGVETLEQGCQSHDFEQEMIDALVEDINDAIGSAPSRPHTIIITAEAARGIAEIAKKEGKENESLSVSIDEQGGFCMEFTKEPPDDPVFFAKEVPEINVYASVLTLSRIGGATIDMREGRFKLDLPEEGCCGDKQDGCGCNEK